MIRKGVFSHADIIHRKQEDVWIKRQKNAGRTGFFLFIQIEDLFSAEINADGFQQEDNHTEDPRVGVEKNIVKKEFQRSVKDGTGQADRRCKNAAVREHTAPGNIAAEPEIQRARRRHDQQILQISRCPEILGENKHQAEQRILRPLAAALRSALKRSGIKKKQDRFKKIADEAAVIDGKIRHLYISLPT